MKYLIIIFIVMGIVNTAIAQDIHFSQTKYAPLSLNPGLTGAENKLTAIVNYRNQWNSVSAPFSTISASIDARLKEKRNAFGFLAIGANFYNDVAGEVKMSNTNASGNIAYHILIDNNSTIGLGIQAGLGQRGIEPHSGLWNNQFTGSGFNPSLSSGENFNQTNFTHFDLSSGIVYRITENESNIGVNNSYEFTAGVAAYHLNRPSTSFLTGSEDDLAIRWSGFAQGSFGIPNTNMKVVPGIYYHRQVGHQEILGGTYLRYRLKQASKITGFFQESAFSIGLFYRMQDALISKFMLEFSSFSLGFAYDINLSSLTKVSRGRGAMEFFLRYSLDNLQPRSRVRIR